MRDKNKSGEELVRLGGELAGICKESKVKFIVNDDPAIAKEVGADGVHLGQEDLEVWDLEKTRALLGPDRIIGVSTHSPEQFKKANAEDIDYIAFGPIFPTKTKDYFIGTGDVEDVLRRAEVPVVFIGGINLNNIDELLRRGARNIAMIRAISEQDDIARAAASFKEKLKDGRCWGEDKD
jgi:thiamine-phosphate pyrophosphorylase